MARKTIPPEIRKQILKLSKTMSPKEVAEELSEYDISAANVSYVKQQERVKKAAAAEEAEEESSEDSDDGEDLDDSDDDANDPAVLLDQVEFWMGEYCKTHVELMLLKKKYGTN